MVRILCLVIGYCFGLIQTSYIYGRFHGVDIRQHGSGNAGTTNALRTLGVKAGIITLLGDCVKCILAVVVVRLLFGGTHSDMIALLALYAAAGTILGHNFPFYLGFHGGKGIAATAGLIISLGWMLTLVELIVFLCAFFFTHYVSLGSLLVYVVFVIGIIVEGQTGYLNLAQGHLTEMYVLAILLALLAFWQHRENIKKLLDGSERKTYLSKRGKNERK